MTRMSKQGERRNTSPRKSKILGKKTGPLKDKLPKGYREHSNAIATGAAQQAFIPKIK